MTVSPNHPSMFQRDTVAKSMIVRRDTLISILRDMDEEIVASAAFGRECTALTDFRERLSAVLSADSTGKHR